MPPKKQQPKKEQPKKEQPKPKKEQPKVQTKPDPKAIDPKAKKQQPKKQQPKKEDPKAKANQSPKKQEKKPEPPKQIIKQQPLPNKNAPVQQQKQDEGNAVMDEAQSKKKQAQRFKKYLEQTGIAMAFQVVFAQILDKKIDESKVFTYTASRLRQIGQDLQKIKLSKK